MNSQKAIAHRRLINRYISSSAWIGMKAPKKVSPDQESIQKINPSIKMTSVLRGPEEPENKSKNYFEYLLYQERTYIPTNYLQRGSSFTNTVVDGDCRNQIAARLKNAAQDHHLILPVVETALNILDRFVTTDKGRSKLMNYCAYQFAGEVALITAMKFHHSQGFCYQYLGRISDRLWGKDAKTKTKDLYDVELEIMMALNFKLTSPTLSGFIHVCIEMVPTDILPCELKVQLFHQAESLVSLFVTDSKFLGIPYSFIGYEILFYTIGSLGLKEADNIKIFLHRTVAKSLKPPGQAERIMVRQRVLELISPAQSRTTGPFEQQLSVSGSKVTPSGEDNKSTKRRRLLDNATVESPPSKKTKLQGLAPKLENRASSSKKRLAPPMESTSLAKKSKLASVCPPPRPPPPPPPPKFSAMKRKQSPLPPPRGLPLKDPPQPKSGVLKRKQPPLPPPRGLPLKGQPPPPKGPPPIRQPPKSKKRAAQNSAASASHLTAHRPKVLAPPTKKQKTPAPK